MKIKIAQVISLIFHPIVFLLLAPFTIVNYRTFDFDYGLKWVIFSAVFLFLGLFTFFFLRPVQFITDFDISKRQNRPLFYTVALCFALLYFFVSVILKGIYFSLSLVSLGIIFGIIIFEGANFYLKVSVHCALAAVYVITVGILYGFWAFLFICWIPLAVAWARLTLKKHTRMEVLSGIVIGILIPVVTFAVIKILL